MTKQKKFITCDGNQAAAHIAICLLRLLLSTLSLRHLPMAEYVDEWAAKGRKNIFGNSFGPGNAIRGWCCRCSTRFSPGWCLDNNLHCFSGFVADDS